MMFFLYTKIRCTANLKNNSPWEYGSVDLRTRTCFLNEVAKQMSNQVPKETQHQPEPLHDHPQPRLIVWSLIQFSIGRKIYWNGEEKLDLSEPAAVLAFSVSFSLLGAGGAFSLVGAVCPGSNLIGLAEMGHARSGSWVPGWKAIYHFKLEWLMVLLLNRHW